MLIPAVLANWASALAPGMSSKGRTFPDSKKTKGFGRLFRRANRSNDNPETPLPTLPLDLGSMSSSSQPIGSAASPGNVGVINSNPAIQADRTDEERAEDLSTKAQSTEPGDTDTIITLKRYEAARTKLNYSLKLRRKDWGTFEFPELQTISEQQDSAKLQSEIDKVMNARKDKIANPTAWIKSKGIVKQIFMALSPFAKNLLTVAQNAQSVRNP